MNMTCDLCGGPVLPEGDRGVCSQCGLTYDAQWVRQRYVNPPVAPATSFTPPPVAPTIPFAPPTEPSTPAPQSKKKKSFKWSGVVFALCGIGVFAAGWMADEDPMFSLGMFGACAAVTVITIGIIAALGKKN